MTDSIGSRIFYRHYDLPANFPVIALLGDNWLSTPDPVSRLHFHNCVEIGYLYEGSGFLLFEHERIPFTAPAVVMVPPNTPHFTQSDNGTICRWNWLYVDPTRMLSRIDARQTEELHRFLLELGGPSCVISGKEQPAVLSIVRMIIDEMAMRRAYDHAIVRNLFSTLYLYLFRTLPESGEHQASGGERYLGCIAPAIAHIADNYMSNITVEELADLCHISNSHFRRLFKQVLGWAPQEYLQIVRIGHACDLLYNNDLSITEVSIRVGYSAPSSLTRQFQQMYGISPNQWRQKARKEENLDVIAYFDSIPKQLLR